MPKNSLQRLPIGTSAIVKAINHKDADMRRRLLDIGFTQNASVMCLYQSPANDPRAYLIRDAVIALRKEEAETIQVKYKRTLHIPHEKAACLPACIFKKARRDSFGADK